MLLICGKWMASKRIKTKEEEQEDEKLMGVYNSRFFLKKNFMEGFFQFLLTEDFFQFFFMEDFFQFVIAIFNFMFIS